MIKKEQQQTILLKNKNHQPILLNNLYRNNINKSKINKRLKKKKQLREVVCKSFMIKSKKKIYNYNSKNNIYHNNYNNSNSNNNNKS